MGMVNAFTNIFSKITVFETARQTIFGWKYTCRIPFHKPSQNHQLKIGQMP